MMVMMMVMIIVENQAYHFSDLCLCEPLPHLCHDLLQLGHLASTLTMAMMVMMTITMQVIVTIFVMINCRCFYWVRNNFQSSSCFTKEILTGILCHFCHSITTTKKSLQWGIPYHLCQKLGTHRESEPHFRMKWEPEKICLKIFNILFLIFRCASISWIGYDAVSAIVFIWVLKLGESKSFFLLAKRRHTHE